MTRTMRIKVYILEHYWKIGRHESKFRVYNTKAEALWNKESFTRVYEGELIIKKEIKVPHDSLYYRGARKDKGKMHTRRTKHQA